MKTVVRLIQKLNKKRTKNAKETTKSKKSPVTLLAGEKVISSHKLHLGIT